MDTSPQYTTTPTAAVGPSKIVQVRWKSCVVGFDNATVESIIKKACAHFQLGRSESQLMLVGEVDGLDLEVSNDILKRLPHGATIKLQWIPCEVSDVGYRCNGPSNASIPAPTTLAFGLPVRELRIAKPVIYLFPPRPLETAAVSIRLVSQWSFTHLYPAGRLKLLNDGTQTITWTVSSATDGTLVDKDTNLELSYLFWEAAPDLRTPTSPPASPVLIDEAMTLGDDFDPANPSLESHSPTSVLLPFAELLPYLDKVLKGLALHTAARNDFITYWLPALSKQSFVALRFLSSAAYERAAELRVEPAPCVTTRVFMLFRGVRAEEVRNWEAASTRLGQIDWCDVVGVRDEAWDVSQFRVLEWGGMEVL